MNKKVKRTFEHNGHILTYREVEVLLCCAKGMTIKETATTLFISPKTVQRHHENLNLRFGLHGYHALTCFSTGLLSELEKWVK